MTNKWDLFMTQTEMAGGPVTPPNELPLKGHRLYNFRLISTSDQQVSLSDYRGRSNLVLVFADDASRAAELLLRLAQHYKEIENEEAEVVVIVRLPREEAVELKKQLKLPYPVLIDELGRIHESVRANSAQRTGESAVYITDRFGEIVAIYRTCDGQSLPSIDDVLEWLEFVNAQCPECEAPEWPT